MGIFDIFTNDAQQTAANSQIAGITSGQTQATSDYTKAIEALKQSAGIASGQLTSNYTSALQPYLTNYSQAQKGASAYADALGLGGTAGNQRATTAFWNNPGIQTQINTGTENALRNAARTGTLASGGTEIALQKTAQDAASQQWNTYVSQLQPYLSQENTAASGIANIYTGLGSSLANVSTGLGTNVASQYGNLANLDYNAATSKGNAQANADLGNLTASQNIWNTVGNAAKLGVSLATLSDERTKTDKEKIGELYDGTNVYRFKYAKAFDPFQRTQVGLMAQEVEKTAPDAVTEIGGVKFVDYGKATEKAADYASTFEKFLKAA